MSASLSTQAEQLPRDPKPPFEFLKHRASPFKAGPYLSPQNRAEVQMFNYSNAREHLHKQEANILVDFLRKAGRIPPLPADLFNEEFSFDTFVACTNTLSGAIKGRYFDASKYRDREDLGPLVLKYTESRTPTGHHEDTLCRPDYTMAFERNWTSSGHISWPLIELVGEKASKGDTEPEMKTISYLHYFMTARPDLNVALGLLTSKTGVTFFVAVQGTSPTIYTTIAWGAAGLPGVMFAFIYRLYQPGSWGKRDWLRRRIGEKENPITDFEVSMTTLAKKRIHRCKGWQTVYASSPFQTRTHVLANPSSELVIDGKCVTVIKDQLCKKSRFTEKEIYDQIHRDGPVPGVAQPVFHAVLESKLVDSRTRYITGLQEYGRLFMTVDTVGEMLEVLYDVIELLRYLRFKCNVLHRDISKGNILIIDSQKVPPSSKEGKHKDLCFIKHLLDPLCDPHETSVLIIDFNHAEHVTEKTEDEYERDVRTGTPGFLPRAVEKNGPLPLPKNKGYFAPPIPDAPAAYKSQHPDRLTLFPESEEVILPTPAVDAPSWRREVDHDTEAVFWLFLYWAMGAQPVGQNPKGQEPDPAELLDSATWAAFAGKWTNRNSIINSQPPNPKIVHSSFLSLIPLIEALSRILTVDRSWPPDDNLRKHPAYVGEAFQRLILEFRMRNKDEAFMKLKVDILNRRTPDKIPQLLSFSVTSVSQLLSDKAAAERQKRKLESHTQQEDNGEQKKKPRLGGATDVPKVQVARPAVNDEAGGPYQWENAENNDYVEQADEEADEGVNEEADGDSEIDDVSK